MQGPSRLPGCMQLIFDPSQHLRVPPRPYGRLLYRYNQQRQQKTMVQVTQLPPHHRMSCGEMVYVPPAPAPATSLLIQVDLFAHRLNQLVPYEIQLNMNDALELASVFVPEDSGIVYASSPLHTEHIVCRKDRCGK
ncbi:hypothetical protein HAX54_045281 [Datura stramonium]|uniref:Uncharacterized protein n=1 Tax=Datura stramonium TaxID=4076 RepID=A0ABS8RHA0_DATST|nr:hypothetical protein [Datura stramonium]